MKMVSIMMVMMMVIAMIIMTTITTVTTVSAEILGGFVVIAVPVWLVVSVESLVESSKIF